MNEKHHSLRTRLTALLLALICVLGLFPTTAFAAGDTITLKELEEQVLATPAWPMSPRPWGAAPSMK